VNQVKKIVATAVATVAAFTLSTGIAHAVDEWSGNYGCAGQWGTISSRLTGGWALIPPGNVDMIQGIGSGELVQRQAATERPGGGYWYAWGQVSATQPTVGCSPFGRGI